MNKKNSSDVVDHHFEMVATVTALLSQLNLNKYAEVFEEEAITETSLLSSMGSEMLRENLEELGLDSDAINQLAEALFPGDGKEQQGLGQPQEEEDELLVEDNLEEAAVEESSPIPSGGDTLPDDLTQEEIDAAEAEAQWLLNPLSMLDLSYTKSMLQTKMREGIDFQKRGQHGMRQLTPAKPRYKFDHQACGADSDVCPVAPANARAVFTKALSFEAPNKKINAAFYYNRSACQRQLGQLSLALRDAQLVSKGTTRHLATRYSAHQAPPPLLGERIGGGERPHESARMVADG